MSSYLNRLAMRAQVTREPQMLRPFVRSTSPVVDRDQRIGVAGFENIEFGVAPYAESNLEVGVEQGEIVQASMPPRVTMANNPAETVVQRKIAGSTPDSGLPAPGSASVTIAAPSPERSDPPAVERITAQSKDPKLLVAERLVPSDTEPNPTGQTNLHQGSTESSNPPIVAEPGDTLRPSPLDQPLYPLEQQSSLPQVPAVSGAPEFVVETRRVADTVPPVLVPAIAPDIHDAGLKATPSAVPTADFPATPPDPSPFPSSDPVQPGELNEVRPRAVRQAQQVDAPSLEPSTRLLVDRVEPLFEAAPVSGLDEVVSPRVVIGRINVEVVAPPAVEVPATPSRPGPVTAESVSVIGPLGGRVRSNVRFSLRQR